MPSNSGGQRSQIPQSNQEPTNPFDNPNFSRSTIANHRNFTPTAEFVLDRVINYTQSAEGSLLPPRQSGDQRVPFAENVQAIRPQNVLGGTVVTVTWEEPSSLDPNAVSHYNIFLKNIYGGNENPLLLASAKTSPAQVRVTIDNPSNATFTVQTVLKNGQVSDLETGPSASTAVNGYRGNCGEDVMTAGTVLILTPFVTTRSLIFLAGQNSSGTHGELTVSARTPGVDFTITSSNAADTRRVAWFLIEP